ncbi:MAG: hypothetical protein DRR19_00595 [Candidatus Parabeggiatoa sp. nov. 1]|nr:MAG: hypothetical protein DRR19_00595 [Gammaproteobacteria bacterium]
MFLEDLCREKSDFFKKSDFFDVFFLQHRYACLFKVHKKKVFWLVPSGSFCQWYSQSIAHDGKL